MYNPDDPKIHCTTLQILDNYWNDNNTNIPNPNKKPEDFTEILTEKDIISNGNVVCKNPSTPNATFTAKDAVEGETVIGTCNKGYMGTVSAICQKDGGWGINNNCLSDCNNLENMYADSSFITKIDKILNDELVYSKCDTGYDGYKKHKCENGKIGETENLCRLNTNYCQKLTNIENGSITYNNNQAINSTATLKCNTGYKVNGNNSTVCNTYTEINGKWSASLGSCEIVRCPKTTLVIDNGSYPTITSTNNTYNTTISGTCNTGYTGSITATCNADGSWEYAGNCEVVLATVDCGNGTLVGDKANGYCTYYYKGEMQTFSATANVSTTIYLTIWGAQGGKGNYPITRGGKSYGSLTLDPGITNLYVYVGGQGQQATARGELGAGGWNGGGDCYKANNYDCGGGGGATDIRKGGTNYSNRIIVAGGGGGGGQYGGGYGGGGNSDGGNSGVANGNCAGYTSEATGGTSTGPGTGALIIKDIGCSKSKPGNDGEGPKGGDINKEQITETGCNSAGGGGGGYFGGGSGAITLCGSNGGGGGSGYIGGVENGGGYNGTRSGDGLAKICWGSYANNSKCN